MKDIFEFAMQMERDGEKYYRDLAERCEDKGLKSILTMLAEAEVGHYNVFKAMAEGTNPDQSKSTLVSNVKNMFAKMKGRTKPFDFEMSHIDMYKKAQDLEKKSEDFYLKKAEAAETEDQRQILTKMAKEEHQHYIILGNLIDFVSGPATWLANAEWHQMEDF